MKKRIYNISWLLALLAVVTLGFTACDTDTDSNPTLDLSHDLGFHRLRHRHRQQPDA